MNLFPKLNGTWTEIDLSREALKSNLDLVDPQICQKVLNEFHKKKKVDFSYGGFLEDRTSLWRKHPNSNRTLIHLGIDYWVPAGTTVALPIRGTVFHIMKDPDNKLGWGGRIIFKLDDETYLAFGHLKQNISLKIGQKINVGDMVGEIGEVTENGNWATHLHIQLMKQEFIDIYKTNLDGLMGYLPRKDKNLKYIINPSSLIDKN